METLTATLATLLAIWVITCVAFYVHANTQDKTIASYRAYGTRLVLERDTLAKSVEELLQAFNTVTAERDRLMLAHIAISDAYTAECDGAYCDRQALNAMTTECNELRTELEQAKPRIAELEQALRIERMTLESTMATAQELQRQVWRIELAERAQAFNISNA
jgi:hypothetical protein